MTARILVVDDLLPNIKLLEIRLNAEYFDVLAATSGPEAIAICERGDCDVVLLDVMMPGMDGFEVCRRLKASTVTAHLPVVMVTALDQPSDRLKGLEAGADDFLTKPVNEVALLARVKSLVRLKMLTDELRSRAAVSRDVGLVDPNATALSESGLGGRILLVDDQPSSSERLAASLAQNHQVDAETDPQQALFRAPDGDYDLIIVSLALAHFDGLRLCSQLRALERTRKVPLLIIASMGDDQRVLRGLEIGVNDYLVRPVDRNEMLARVRTQIRRKRFIDGLDEALMQSVAAAIVDQLTGLNNRRFMQSHLAQLINQGASHGTPFSLMILDIDHFKSVNDSWGHDAGDEVLKEFAARVRKAIRGIDMPCRVGGEEFVILLPDTEQHVAQIIAERIRQKVERQPFPIHGGKRSIPVTVSIGVAGARAGRTTSDALLKRADEALYRAKRDGRNKVVADAA
ncbi:MAG: PleD family two-component system response regulator [Methylocystis sp.]|nr:PleD family two-component system response regulator [Methylocystis sp.]MCA3589449.1 PleD family two-component system response regulator [Methylocystis sp.]MCA3590868.1 PleD family two-component system response regulator [Methylocystis sp.]